MTGKQRKARLADAKSASDAPNGALSRENRSREFVAKLVHDSITDAMEAKLHPRTGSNGTPRVRASRS